MSIVATMKLIEVGTTKILAGHGSDEETVFVFRRVGDVYHLHQIPVSEASQELRAFLAASDSEHGELVAAILQTVKTPTRKRKAKRKAR
jgi:hypothetical protein